MDVGRLHAGLPELEDLALGVHPGDADLESPAGADVAVGGHGMNIRFTTPPRKREMSPRNGVS